MHDGLCLILASYTFNEVVPSINPAIDKFMMDASLVFKLDKHSDKIPCMERWRSSTCGNQLLATISQIHLNCSHAALSTYWAKRTGNPRIATVVTNAWQKAQNDLSSHMPNGDSALMVHELVELVEYLRGLAMFAAMRQLVMSLLACRLGLRQDELCKIQFRHIHLGLCPVQMVDGKLVIYGMTFEIQGKTDKHTVYLVAHADVEIAEMDIGLGGY
ncbi:hypothetical protein HDU98_007772, partial [Podochytrium sp. JEL0797]